LSSDACLRRKLWITIGYVPLAADLKSDGNGDVEPMHSGLASNFGDFMAAYAAEHGYNVILDSSQQHTPVLYVDPSADITKAVIQAYNVRSGIAPPPAQPATAPKPAAQPTKPPPSKTGRLCCLWKSAGCAPFSIRGCEAMRR